MRFGIYVEMQCPPGKSHHQLTREILDQIVHADACGFSSYATVEHYFFQEFGISANPLALFAAAAQRTERIRFRTALHVVPLHNPMVLASQVAEAVLLTEGRLDVGLGVAPLLPYGALREGLESYAGAARAAGHRPEIS